MDVMILIIAIVAVGGLVATCIVQLVSGRKEREGLYKLIKSETLGDFITAVDKDEKEEKEPEEVEIPVDEIPFIEPRE
jgi:hypothetical protein